MQKFIGLFVVFSALATPAFSGDGRFQVMKIGEEGGYTYKSNSYTFQKDGIWYFSRRVPADLRRHYRTDHF